MALENLEQRYNALEKISAYEKEKEAMLLWERELQDRFSAASAGASESKAEDDSPSFAPMSTEAFLESVKRLSRPKLPPIVLFILSDLVEGLKDMNRPLEYINKLARLAQLLEEQFKATIEYPVGAHNLFEILKEHPRPLSQKQKLLISALNLGEIYSRKIPVEEKPLSHAFFFMQMAYALHMHKTDDISSLKRGFLSLFSQTMTSFLNIPKESVHSLFSSVVSPEPTLERPSPRKASTLFLAIEALEERFGIKQNLHLYLNRLDDIKERIELDPVFIHCNAATGIQLCFHFLEEIAAYHLGSKNTVPFHHDFEKMLSRTGKWELLSDAEKDFFKHLAVMRNEARGYRTNSIFDRARKTEKGSRKVRGSEGVAQSRSIATLIETFNHTYEMTQQIAIKLL